MSDPSGSRGEVKDRSVALAGPAVDGTLYAILICHDGTFPYNPPRVELIGAFKDAQRPVLGICDTGERPEGVEVGGTAGTTGRGRCTSALDGLIFPAGGRL
jgi:hypothetical protein